MSVNWPDSRLRAALFELNREFLLLVRCTSDRPVNYGLPLAIVRRLQAMELTGIERIARTPCLLTSFACPLASAADGVADALPMVRRPGLAQPAALYAVTLLTWLWQVAWEDPLLAALCLGPGSDAAEELRRLTFREVQRTAAAAADRLEARFAAHPRLWADLVAAAAGSDAELLEMTRLSAVQLTLVAPRAPLAGGAGAGRPYARDGVARGRHP
jgi:hypothetical protein